MSVNGYIDNLKNALSKLQEYNSQLEEISQELFRVLNSEKGKIYILGAGSTADFSKTLIKGLGHHFKYEHDKIVVLEASMNNNFDFEEENIDNENIFSVGVVDAIEANLNDNDIIIALSSTGRTDYINGFIKEAKSTGSKIAYITSPTDINNTHNLEVDYPITIVIERKNIYGLHIGNHTTLLKTTLEKILFRVFELKGQIIDGYVLTTNAWTKKLIENSLPTIAKYGKELTYEQAIPIFKKADNELSVIIASLILKVSLEEAKEKVLECGYDFNKLIN